MNTPNKPEYMTAYDARIAYVESLGWDASRVSKLEVHPGYVTVTDVDGQEWYLETRNMTTKGWIKL